MLLPRQVVLLLLASLLVGACSLAGNVAEVVLTPTPTDLPALAPTASNTPTLTPRPTGTPTHTLRPTITPEFTPTPTPAPSSSTEAFATGMSARHNGDYSRAAAAFQITLDLKPAADLAREAQFRLGEAYRLAGDDERAIAALNRYLQANPTGAHALETHYYLAELLGNGGTPDYGAALAHLRIVRQQTKTLAGDIDARIADLLARSGDLGGAIAQFDRALQDNTLSAARRADILMNAAAVHLRRGEPTLAAARDEAALALAVDASTRADLYYAAGQAYAAANQTSLAIARWTSAINQAPEQPSAYRALAELEKRNVRVDDYQRGLVDYDADQYVEAIQAFQRYLRQQSARAGDAHYYAARAYFAQKAYAQAIGEYDAILNTLPQDARVPDAFMGKAAANVALRQVDEAVGVYKQFATSRPDAARADEALLQAGMVLESAQRYREAAALFDRLQANYPARKNAAEALFRAGVDYYRLQDNPTAAARWQLLVQRYAASDFYTGALYWLGKVATARGQPDAARSLWTQAAAFAPEVFRPFPRSYYAYRARALIRPAPVVDEHVFDLSRYVMHTAAARPELERWLASWTKSPGGVSGNLDAAIRSDLHFRRGEELVQLGRMVDARAEFSALADARENDPGSLYALARYFQDKEFYSISISCAERLALQAMLASAPPAPRGLILLRFPTYYADLVVAESQANRVDPVLYFAVLRLESHFDPWAKGPVGERGLAQISPPIAPSIVEALNIQDFELDQLYRPYLAIKMGNWLFTQNAKKLDDPVYAFAAYNAGLAAALAWQDPDVDLGVENIDIDMARLYVHIVYPNWQEYLALYH